MRTFLALISVLAAGCGSGPTAPARSALTITSTSPVAGATLVLPPSYAYNFPGGLIIPPGSGHVSADITMSISDNVPWAQLNVYLLTGGTNDQYCGQNLPDAPTWQFLKRGWSANVRITGFQVYRLPCVVTGIRAVLHMRNTGSNMPLTAAETIAEASVSTNIQLRQ